MFQIVDGEVVTGVLDKNAFGKYGLLHAIQELYGALTRPAKRTSTSVPCPRGGSRCRLTNDQGST